jgi:secreted trypsin-like serine protease
MSDLSPFRLAALIPLALISSSVYCSAIVIRHDQADADYIALGSEANYPASGFIGANRLGGTLIAPEYVLTAAHIQGDIVPGVTTFTVGGVAYTIAEQRPHPQFNPTTFENDINVLRLASVVANVTPAAFNTTLPELGATITIIGYGTSGNGLTGASVQPGQRRGAQNTVDAYGLEGIIPETSFVGDFDRPPLTPVDTSVPLGSAVPLMLEGTTALFDSGGGVYANFGSGPVLIGINSFVGSTDGTSNSDYGDLFGATRVSLYGAFIRSNIPEPSTALFSALGIIVTASMRLRRFSSKS